MPFYSFFLDRFVNGDPSNDDANGTAWEHDLMGTQLRHGGDVKGLQDTLDYIAGMGIKGIYVAGSPHVNVPWVGDIVNLSLSSRKTNQSSRLRIVTALWTSPSWIDTLAT